MTSDARKPTVTLSPASAFFQAVGLKTHSDDACHAAKTNIPRSSVAGAAEINRVNWIEPGRIHDEFLPLVEMALSHRRDMPCSRTMAGLATNSWISMLQIELITGC